MVFTGGIVPFYPLQNLTSVLPLNTQYKQAFGTKHDIKLAHQEKLWQLSMALRMKTFVRANTQPSIHGQTRKHSLITSQVFPST